ncbi:MAG: ketoacyl-ACP synthase III [Crocinitomicaceae bacterium]|jgi:3-oxoacyl-[acyl-carrier-protein] synthase-3|nr:ketoacyl-ACP synthase III [Crocinitomicaceae bacterium]MBT5403938.1 ketoacyl-ACP synthase III [Crocinitomicaceae bacterium]MBT6029126.1 ketoacyl-ACP synthase III [Crocinitomicaceae bacterium]MBT6515300.1 ketoacyl-ACP synthase III [Crocinitomicaceae bacterium]
MVAASIKAVSYYLPSERLTNEDLFAEFGTLSPAEIFKRVGVRERPIRGEGQIGSDLAFESSLVLFDEHGIDKSEIDFLLFCTEGLDYKGPATACIMQDRLGLNKATGAMDIPMGCAGFTNGLAIAKALIASGQSKNVLLQTADIPSSVIHPGDLDLRMLFGDAGASALISRCEDQRGIGSFVMGTDGSGAANLMVKRSNTRTPVDTEWLEEHKAVGGLEFGRMEMNGLEIFSFSMREVPPLVGDVLAKNNLTLEEIDLFVFHQANAFILKMLARKLRIDSEKVYNCMEYIGNTVSASVPIALAKASKEGKIKKGSTVLVAAFGIGYSWSGTIIKY